jgi:putative transposase
MISFKGRHHQRDIILQCVRWYVAYSLSYRDLEELTQERRASIFEQSHRLQRQAQPDQYRQKRRSQVDLAKAIGSSQSRVAKMEALLGVLQH